MKVLSRGDKGGKEDHIIDRHYHELKCQMSYIEPEDDQFSLVEKYMRQTHAKTHSQYRLELVDLFQVEREGEKEEFKDVGNRYIDFPCPVGFIQDPGSVCVWGGGGGGVSVWRVCYQRHHCILTVYRKLLWHGSRLTNWVGILSQGLRIAPPEAPVTGYMVRHD